MLCRIAMVLGAVCWATVSGQDVGSAVIPASESNSTMVVEVGTLTNSSDAEEQTLALEGSGSLRGTATRVVGTFVASGCDVVCWCSTPNAGTADHNQFICANGYWGYCQGWQACHKESFCKFELPRFGGLDDPCY
mmetsp:Transcript_84118/g.228411  ORF Transcript_84118/g.228411 Transcript_84118/m.228411 type:complete len:135 (+) Transcript_84118:71-475(+)